MTREMDVLELLRSVRELRLLKLSMLNSAQKILLKFQRSRIIETEESEELEDKVNF